jgi:osmotically-inducible protein OsmY
MMEPPIDFGAALDSQYVQRATGIRSDLEWRIRACLRERLPGLNGDVYITVIGGTAAVRGTVRSLHDKSTCIECCRHVPGVLRVVDDLVIVG